MHKRKTSKPHSAPDFKAVTDEGKRAYESVLDMQIPVPGPLTHLQKEAQLPEDLTQCHSDDLGFHLSLWTALADYASTQAMLLWNDLEVYRARLKDAENDALAQVRPGSSITERKARARNQSGVRQLSADAAHIERVFNLVNTQKENYERNYQAVSREIARRTGTPA